MDTNIRTYKSNSFIYALGLACFLNILSAEITFNEIPKTIEQHQAKVVSGGYNL